MLENEENTETVRNKPIIIRSTIDLQRLKLEKLMKNPEKAMIIPEKPKERGIPTVPDFVRNVMGSSAGAGSGEFHVYRHLRRKEYARQRYMKAIGEKEKLDNDYRDKLEENKRLAEEKTAKKRLKRQNKKKKQKSKGKKPKLNNKESSDEIEDDSGGSDEENAITTEKAEENIIAIEESEETDKQEIEQSKLSEDNTDLNPKEVIENHELKSQSNTDSNDSS